MGQCLSAPRASAQMSHQEIKFVKSVRGNLNTMTGQVTAARKLLDACNKTATELLSSTRANAALIPNHQALG